MNSADRYRDRFRTPKGTEMATAAKRTPVEARHVVEMERDMQRTRKNLESALERAEGYRRHLAMCEAMLKAVS